MNTSEAMKEPPEAAARGSFSWARLGAAAIAVLPELGVTKIGDFWSVAESTIWTGIPLEGQSKFTFWHVVFFAWFCNMAMHIGMSDLSVFRFARKSWYGSAAASGMYVGHFMAWLAAGLAPARFALAARALRFVRPIARRRFTARAAVFFQLPFQCFEPRT